MATLQTERKCYTCKIVLPLSQFGCHKGKPLGLSYKCKECVKAYGASRRKDKAYREAAKLRCEKWRSENRSRHNLNSKEWYANNIEIAKKSRKAWQKENLNKCKTYNVKRRLRELIATPKWANLKAITRVYLDCPIGYQVDHWIPLKGKTVSGLHVESNLIYLTAFANRKKSNQFPYLITETV